MGISIQCLTMNIATSVIILGIILHASGHTQPPKNGIYSEYLRRLSSNQDEQPKEPAGSTRQNELQPPQHVEPKHGGDNSDYYSQAPPKTRDPFFGFHSFRGLPKDRTDGPQKEFTRPDHPVFRHPKTSPPISYGDPESNQYTPPMYRGSSKLHQMMPNKYGRHHFHRARPPYMTPGSQDRYSHEPTFPDFPQTTDNVPNVTDHPHTESSDHPQTQASHHHNQGLDHPHTQSSDHPRTQGSDHPHTQGSDHTHTQGSDHPHTQGSDHQHTQGSDHQHTQGSDHQHTQGSDHQHTQGWTPDLQDQSTQPPNDERHQKPEETPPGPPYRQLDPKELYSPFSSKPREELQNMKSERMRNDSPGEMPRIDNNANVNDTEHEYSLPSGEFDTTTFKGFTPSDELNMLANSPQTTPGTTSVELHGLNKDPRNPFSSINNTEDTPETTTLSYEWPNEQSSTSVSVDFQPIRNMEKDTDFSDHNETNSETYDYDSENKQEEYSDFYDDVYPDDKSFQNEYRDYQEEYDAEENSHDTVNGTSTVEWPDYADGVLYIGSTPSNESINATDTVTDAGFIQGNGNTTVLASTADEKHPVMILAIIIGVGVILIICIVIAIIIMNHLRRKIEEPKLLNFMHNNYCNLAETSFTTGFTNRAYEELDDQSSIAKSMESLAARKIASDSTKLVASYPPQMYGHFQNGGSRYGLANGGHAFPHDGFSANNYQGKFKTPVEIDIDPDLNLTLAAVPVDKRDEAKSICSSESTDDLFVRNDFVNAMVQGMPNDTTCLQQGDEGATECINPLYSSSHTLPILENDDQVSDDTAQYARDNYRNRFLENGGILATSTPETPPSGLYRTSSCPDCSIALDNLSDEVFFKPDFESAKTTDIPVARTKSTEDTWRSLSESNLVHHLAICNGNRDPSQILNNQWEMRTGF